VLSYFKAKSAEAEMAEPSTLEYPHGLRNTVLSLREAKGQRVLDSSLEKKEFYPYIEFNLLF